MANMDLLSWADWAENTNPPRADLHLMTKCVLSFILLLIQCPTIVFIFLARAIDLLLGQPRTPTFSNSDEVLKLQLTF